MLTKKLLPAAIATGLLAGATVPTAQAEMEISGNVALTSDYRFRGISQSNDDIAVQGGFDLAWDNGIYVGTWASSINFGEIDANENGKPDYDGSLELDYYIGWASDIGDSGFGIDVGYLYYDYPGDTDLEGDYQELYGSLSWNDLAVGIAYSDDYYAETGNFMYYYADYSFGFAENFSLDFHIGYNDFDDADVFLSDGADSYIDYSIGLTASYWAVDWSLAWVGTDLDDEEYFEADDLIDDTVIFTISKSM